jgi:hypothetical protein
MSKGDKEGRLRETQVQGKEAREERSQGETIEREAT